jgi:hypothetical protein
VVGARAPATVCAGAEPEAVTFARGLVSRTPEIRHRALDLRAWTPSHAVYGRFSRADCAICPELCSSGEVAIDIKRWIAPSVSLGFRLACETVRPKAMCLLHGGYGTWPVGKDTTEVALPDLVHGLATS